MGVGVPIRTKGGVGGCIIAQIGVVFEVTWSEGKPSFAMRI